MELLRTNVSLDWPGLEGKPKNAEGGVWLLVEGTFLLNTRKTRGPFGPLLGLSPGACAGPVGVGSSSNGASSMGLRS
jgi:hypothetical protein